MAGNNAALHRRAHPAYSSVEAFSGDQTYKDKAFDLNCVCGKRVTGCRKWRLVRGNRRYGAVRCGISCRQQSLGAFDFTLGLGWGYLGTSGNVKNRSVRPVTNIAIAITATNKRVYRRQPDVPRSGLTVWRRGIQTPWQPLRLKLEYEGNNYQQILPVSWSKKVSLTSGRFIAYRLGRR